MNLVVKMPPTRRAVLSPCWLLSMSYAALWIVAGRQVGGAMITVFWNTLNPAQYGVMGGATLISDTQTSSFVNSSQTELAFCMRFNIKVMGRQSIRRGMLLRIADWQEDNRTWLAILINAFYRKPTHSSSSRSVVRMFAEFPLSFLDLGFGNSQGAFSSYLLKDPQTGSYAVFLPYIWNHLCYSFKQGDHSRLVLASARAYYSVYRSVAKHLICRMADRSSIQTTRTSTAWSSQRTCFFKSASSAAATLTSSTVPRPEGGWPTSTFGTELCPSRSRFSGPDASECQQT